MKSLAALALAAIALCAHAQTSSDLEQRTFFGYGMGERIRSYPGGLADYTRLSIANVPVLTNQYVIKRDKIPSWMTAEMPLDQTLSPDGIRIESVFVIDVFKGFDDKYDERNHNRRMQELVDMVSSKVGKKPTRSGDWKRKIRNPVDARTPPMTVQYAVWELPWGEVNVVGCRYRSFPDFECSYDDARFTLVARTNTMLEAIHALEAQARQQKQQVEQNRLKF